ncbi:hypothetical protein D3C84_588000 [compost metagenome]
MAGQGAVGLGEMEARQLELRRQLVEVEAVVQVRPHHRLHGIHVQHPAGLEVTTHRQHGQGSEQGLQLMGGVDEVRQVQPLLAQRQQGIEVRQQARLHADAAQRGLAEGTQVLGHQFAFEMHPVDAPGPLRIGAIGMQAALRQ